MSSSSCMKVWDLILAYEYLRRKMHSWFKGAPADYCIHSYFGLLAAASMYHEFLSEFPFKITYMHLLLNYIHHCLSRSITACIFIIVCHTVFQYQMRLNQSAA